MARTGRILTALAGAALVLVIATWFDTVFLRDAIVRARATFEMSGVGALSAVGAMLVAGSVLLVALLAWRAASLVVCIGYALAGAFIVGLPLVVMNLAMGINDAPPVLPEPLSIVLSDIYYRIASGPLNAVGTIGAGMLITGVVALVRWPWARAAAKGSTEALSPAAGPTPSS
jgi:hypothetical protein